MRALRILIIVFTFAIIQVAITACCESFSYTIDGVILQNLVNETVTSAQDIQKTEYGIRIDLLGQKHYSVGSYSSGNAKACDCFSEYPHTQISDIKIKALEPGTSAATDVTGGFMGILWVQNDYYGYAPISELAEQINYYGGYINEVHLKPQSNLSLEGYLEFIVEITLENNQILTDTTNVVRIY
jgi:hypothetical protein